MLRGNSIFLRSQSSHIIDFSYNLNAEMCVRLQVIRKSVLSDVPSFRSSWTVSKYGIAFLRYSVFLTFPSKPKLLFSYAQVLKVSCKSCYLRQVLAV